MLPGPIARQFRAQKEASVARGANGVGKHRGTGSLQNIPHRPQGPGFFDECLFLVHGEKDHLRRFSATQFGHRLEAVHDGHRDVHHNHFRVQTAALLQQFAPVRNRADNLEFPVQNTLELPQHGRIVIGEQNLKPGTDGSGPVRIFKRLTQDLALDNCCFLTLEHRSAASNTGSSPNRAAGYATLHRNDPVANGVLDEFGIGL